MTATAATVPDPGFIERAPAGLEGWLRCFSLDAMPVLADTAEALDALRPLEDRIDAHTLAEQIGDDPLMTLKLLAHVGQLMRRRHADARGDAETVTAALVMLGIAPFFRQFAVLDTVERRLQDRPEALEGFRAVLHRSHRAANFAIGFAVHRMDHDADVIHEAALLHDFAELLLWVQAPALALEIQARQAGDAALRSAAVQRAVLHVDLATLQRALMRQWMLPELLLRLDDDHPADAAAVRNVQLAIRVARHSARGWDNAALPDDLREIGALLQLGPGPTLNLLHQIDG